MRVKLIIDEDFQNYKKISMIIGTCSCTWKCCKEQGIDCSICQNSKIFKEPTLDIPNIDIVNRYKNNNLSEAIVFGGLEPFDQFEEMKELIMEFRNSNINDDIVIYTGYNENEINNEIKQLKKIKNIIIKFGRYIPNHKKHYDDILGVNLASKNQYGKIIS